MDSTMPEVGSNPSANTFEDENEAVDTNDPSSRKHSKKEWEDQRSRIADLYESGTLQNLTNVMMEDYQFEATSAALSPSMYYLKLIIHQPQAVQGSYQEMGAEEEHSTR
jgi:hypothetical protein